MYVLKSTITLILASLYLFPFEIVGIPGNTKMMLAVGGLLLLGYELSRGGSALLNKNLFILSLMGVWVSLSGIVSVAVNNTPDYVYATYIMSMWVWLGAAYFIVKLMSAVHKEMSVPIICKYLIVVCVFQCLMSILIDRFDGVRVVVDTYIEQGQDFLKSMVGIKRKYGVGASLDVAGSRFSAVLVMISVLFTRANDAKRSLLCAVYGLCFIFISVQGNAIARTTTVGMLLGAIWLLRYVITGIFYPNKKKWRVIFVSFSIGVVIALGTVYLYHTDKQFNQDVRFGFEGFFSLYEKGHWDVSSNDKLKTMVVWPNNSKTWIIGDGYFSNPIGIDPYFNGVVVKGYYMGTDIGYLRFIFYFGVIGLLAFSVLMCYSARVCIAHFKEFKWLFLMLLFLNFIVWLKVSTDLFVVFAPFLVLAAMGKIAPQRNTPLLCE